MNIIRVNHLLPSFISDTEASVSEVWRHDVTFRKGEYCLVSAASGAGKSSLLSYMFGERSDYTGDILYDDRNIASLTPGEWSDVRLNRIAFVFQGLRLFADLTVYENIAIQNRPAQHKTDEEIMHLLDSAGLAGKRSERAARLSFGQQQRAATIRALCRPFDFLLMDEPFSHLDDENIGIMSGIITRELQNNRAGLILCSLGAEYPFTYHQTLKL